MTCTFIRQTTFSTSATISSQSRRWLSYTGFTVQACFGIKSKVWMSNCWTKWYSPTLNVYLFIRMTSRVTFLHQNSYWSKLLHIWMVSECLLLFFCLVLFCYCCFCFFMIDFVVKFYFWSYVVNCLLSSLCGFPGRNSSFTTASKGGWNVSRARAPSANKDIWWWVKFGQRKFRPQSTGCRTYKTTRAGEFLVKSLLKGW